MRKFYLATKKVKVTPGKFLWPKSQLLYAKFQGHWFLGSRENFFLSVLTIYGHGSSTWNLAFIVPLVSEKETFEECGRP